MKIIVTVLPKKNVLDPQGAAVEHAMKNFGYCPGSNVRVGKNIEFEMQEPDSPQIREKIDRICNDLLSNPIIEDYSYQIVT